MREGQNNILRLAAAGHTIARMRLARPLLLTTLGLLAVACDKPEPPPADAPPPAAAKKPARPTTQQLLGGPRKTLPLGLLPFTVEVPDGWAVQNRGPEHGEGLTMLEGPIVGGDAHVILRVREIQSAERMKLLVDRFRRDEAALEKDGGKLTVRDLGEVRIVDRREMPRPTTTPTTGVSAEGFEKPVEWRIALFVPAGVNYEQYEMQFIDLSPAAYAANAKLLNDLIGSLKYQDSAHPPL